MRKDLEPSAVSYCLRWLESRGYLDDRAFAAALTRERLRFSPRSPFLIERELRNKKVRGPLAHEVVESVMEEEGRTASDLARTAAGHWVRKQNATVRGHLVGERFSPEREKARRRLYGFLARRGFVGEAIRAGMDAGEEEARETKD